jgi:hypothetical protein
LGGGKKTTQISPPQSTEKRSEHQKTAHTRWENAATATSEGTCRQPLAGIGDAEEEERRQTTGVR